MSTSTFPSLSTAVRTSSRHEHYSNKSYEAFPIELFLQCLLGGGGVARSKKGRVNTGFLSPAGEPYRKLMDCNEDDCDWPAAIRDITDYGDRATIQNFHHLATPPSLPGFQLPLLAAWFSKSYYFLITTKHLQYKYKLQWMISNRVLRVSVSPCQFLNSPGVRFQHVLTQWNLRSSR